MINLWKNFTRKDLMWPGDQDPVRHLVRVFKDTLHINYRVVDTDLLCEYIDRFLGQLPPDPDIIDAGGGWGRVALPLATAGYRVQVLDASTSYMAQGQELAQQFHVSDKVTFSHIDVLKDELPDQTVDMVLYIESIEYFPELEDKIAAAQRLFKLLRPGGHLIITAVDKLAMANFAFRRLLFWSQIPELFIQGASVDLRGEVFYPPTPHEFDAVLASLKGDVIDRRTLLHTDSILMNLSGFVPSLYYDNPDLPRRLFELNCQLMDDPAYRDRGFFHAACVQMPL